MNKMMSKEVSIYEELSEKKYPLANGSDHAAAEWNKRTELLRSGFVEGYKISEELAVEFKDWCDKKGWEEDYKEQKSHSTKELFSIWFKSLKQKS